MPTVTTRNPAEQPRIVSPVDEALSALDEAERMLRENIEMLEIRLGNVLTQIPTDPSPGEDMNTVVPSNLASRIRDYASFVNHQAKRIHEIVDRLEI